MKRSSLFICLLFVFGSVQFASAQYYKCTKGKLSFFSEAPMENIEAHSMKGSSVLNSETGEIVCKIPIKTFKFEKSLMEEHFNENYMESEKYPDGTLKGKFDEEVDYATDGEYPVTIKGTLTIHGVEQEREVPGKIVVKDGKVQGIATFTVKLEDHEIEIPKVVVKNIAEEVEVKVDFAYLPVEK